ncbi:MAG: Alpha-L-arabinofuranosidase [Firmicutes bacterium]|nr:Alpha-L-arabinofuranosidase [Bacillota bacterium]
MSRINIKTANKKIPVAKNLYGIFLEDINRAVDGGLYPELIRNRTFEDSIPPIDCTTDETGYAVITASGWRDEFNHGEGLSRWVRQNEVAYTPIPAWYSVHAGMELDLTDTLNIHRQAALDVNFSKNGKIVNTGFCGIPQNLGASYSFYMFAKADVPVEVIVEMKDGETIYSGTKLRINTNQYIRYDAVLTAKGESQNAKLEISCPDGGRIKIGFISLMPSDTYLGHGLRKDIVEKLKDLNPRFFRFPGGCIVEGISPSTAMRFRNIVGPAWERPGHLLMWHYRTYNGLGFHEYLQLCEDLAMEPLYVFNCGMTCQARNSVLMEGAELEDMIQDTLDAIEYAVGAADTKWGSLRAAMGHPEPFGMNYVEIGNENSGSDYEERYLKCYNAIIKKYPRMKFVANTHVEKMGLPADLVDEHYYNTAEYFAENTHLFDDYDRNGPEIFLGEVSVVRGFVGQLYGALGEAAFFTGVEKNQDIVTMTSYAPLLENVNYQAWYPNLLRFNHTKCYGIPSYYVWKLFGNHRGEYIVETGEETGRIHRPVKGMASLLGAAGIEYRFAHWNGAKAEVSHELMGRVKESSRICTVKKPDEEQRAESTRYYNVNPEEIFVIFGEEEVVSGTFEIEIKAERDREIILGIFSSRIPKEVYISDETHPPKEWNPDKVRPFLWRLKDGRSSLWEKEFPEHLRLDKEKAVKLKEGEFNHFRYTTDGKKLSLFVNGELVHDIEVPSFQALNSVVSDSDTEVIIKLVNMADQVDEVSLELDCEVCEEYKAYILTGDKTAENSFKNPDRVCDEECILKGADRTFNYVAPPFSVNVLRLTKKA